mgnify:CR=1 FL=1
MISPEPKTIAFGGVATGNIKAQLEAIVVGITKYIGLVSNPKAKTIKIGANVATVAVLEFSSVKNIIRNTKNTKKTPQIYLYLYLYLVPCTLYLVPCTL